MKHLLYELFGTYIPMTYVNELGEDVIPNGLSGVDIPYICGVVLFGICLWQLLGIVRGFVNRG